MEKVLFLTIKKTYFDRIESGVKTSEFRAYKPYWIKRLMNDDGSMKHYDAVLFQNGYNANAPRLLVELKSISIVRYKISWLKSEKLFELKLGKIR
ncbi:MAG: hypothetical protein ACLFM1_08405 [Bacteroidales bacterium]